MGGVLARLSHGCWSLMGNLLIRRPWIAHCHSFEHSVSNRRRHQQKARSSRQCQSQLLEVLGQLQSMRRLDWWRRSWLCRSWCGSWVWRWLRISFPFFRCLHHRCFPQTAPPPDGGFLRASCSPRKCWCLRSVSIKEYCDTTKFGTDKNQLNGSAHEYVFVNDVIILLDGDLIVTTKLVVDLHSDFVSTDPLSGSCAAWSMLHWIRIGRLRNLRFSWAFRCNHYLRRCERTSSNLLIFWGFRRSVAAIALGHDLI